MGTYTQLPKQTADEENGVRVQNIRISSFTGIALLTDRFVPRPPANYIHLGEDGSDIQKVLTS